MSSEMSRVSPDELKLWAKLLKIMASIDTIPKNGINSDQGYAFIRDIDVYETIRRLLVENNVAFFPNMVSTNTNQVGESNKGHKKIYYICNFEFMFIDVDTGASVTSTWQGECIEWSDKGISKASTSAEKNFLLKTFMIPGGEPDQDERSIERGDDQKQRGNQQHNRNNSGHDRSKNKNQQAWTASAVKGFIDYNVRAMGITREKLADYLAIQNLDNLESWKKYTDRKAALDAITTAHEQAAAAGGPATPKNLPQGPTPQTNLN